MIQFQTINGLSLNTPTSLPRIQRTPEGIAMGAIPGWSVFIDPAYANSGSARNRAQPNRVPMFSGDIIFTTINGKPGFNLTNDFPARLMGPIGGEINPERWSVFFVTSEMSINTYESRQEIISPIEELSSGICLRITMTEFAGYAVSIYEHSNRSPGQPIRLSYENAALNSAAPSLIMCTFSVENGLSIWRNGIKVAAAENDKRALTFATDRDDYEMFRFRRGKQGMTGLLNIDLNAPENAGYRRAIEKYLMGKYSI
ncbi:hypothetical protein ACT3UG_01330 [Halomonas sp. AOP27-A1-34]|uniref:hypothetical protein n=1 Tax=Halomonas sp. AOP27-A1-34 TaxID=3457708 RepID=UPI004034CB93